MFSHVRMKKKPVFMIIPMIDIIFFLLVFFMMNSLQTVAQKSPFRPAASGSERVGSGADALDRHRRQGRPYYPR